MTIFARNQWYVIAWSHEVGRKPLARLICDEPVMLYRREDGTVVALEDACPHRLLPLSMGTVIGDAIQCRYHGLLLDSAGQCLEMPGGDPVNRAVCARAYPIVERQKFVWVWIGDADRADPSLLPHLWMNEAEGWRVDGGVFEVRCDYRLFIDNLMDLTHETTVHASSIGQKELHQFPIETQVFPDRVVTSRWMPAVVPAPLYRSLMGGHDGPVDRWQIITYLPPAGVLIDVGVARVEHEVTLEDHGKAEIQSFILDFITPATAKTCHYFWGSARNFDIDDDEAFNRLTAAQGKVFEEDVEVLEAQQLSIDRMPHRKLRAYGVDAGGVKARLLLDKLIRAAAANPESA
ncbi:aromatic ring-hydroxylating dioxygenase subunit alpha [Sphingobium sp.]|uniref:aromatic ring-hydroxylating dioxygenase subunit alpha n=1 Tax=Sphingobium sp. TaxID=1912891 RepID=UPI0028BDF996|nr:aromatic ring-hydroxylating dioxygenase subunit alpha [Sphingobium sp.]